MGGHRRVDLQGQIGGRTDSQRNPALGKQGHHPFIFNRAHAVIDPIRAKEFNGITHSFRTARLTGMDRPP